MKKALKSMKKLAKVKNETKLSAPIMFAPYLCQGNVSQASLLRTSPKEQSHL
jgi:hypothetical protein